LQAENDVQANRSRPGGQNIALEFRYADGAIERLPELAAELARLRPSSFEKTREQFFEEILKFMKE
jgi:hypothetical protein